MVKLYFERDVIPNRSRVIAVRGSRAVSMDVVMNAPPVGEDLEAMKRVLKDMLDRKKDNEISLK